MGIYPCYMFGSTFGPYIYTRQLVSISFVSFVMIYILSLNYFALCMWILIAAYNRILSIKEFVQQMPKDQSSSFKEALMLYDKFCETMSLINSCLGITFSTVMFELLYHCVVQFFNVYNFVEKKPSSSDTYNFIKSLFEIFYEAIFPACIFTCSSLINSEAENCLQILTNSEGLDGDLMKAKQFAALQFEHQNSEISCEMFVVDWKFLFLLIVCGFNYMIVLIQFDTA